MSTIRKVWVPVMGFTQTALRQTGMETLWCRLRELSSQATWVFSPQPWSTDARAIAAQVDRIAAPDAQIYVMPYSWGAGQFFIDFANALAALKRPIHHAVICDGVYRSRLLPHWLPANPLSMTRLPKLKVPANVREVTWFFQRQNRPAGHEPVAVDPLWTLIHPGRELKLRHEQMDDCPEFHRAVLELAGLPA